LKELRYTSIMFPRRHTDPLFLLLAASILFDAALATLGTDLAHIFTLASSWLITHCQCFALVCLLSICVWVFRSAPFHFVTAYVVNAVLVQVLSVCETHKCHICALIGDISRKSVLDSLLSGQKAAGVNGSASSSTGDAKNGNTGEAEQKAVGESGRTDSGGGGFPLSPSKISRYAGKKVGQLSSSFLDGVQEGVTAS
jgi:hypothetical protein